MTKPTLIIDLEVYKNYFVAGFLNAERGTHRHFEMFIGHPLDKDGIRTILERYRLISFNGNNYDMPMLSAALNGATCEKVKELSDKIIVNNIKPWNLSIPDLRCDHIDIFEVAPGMASLKIYGGRLHAPKLQDLPIEPSASISVQDREDLKTYNVNDLQTTLALFNHLKPQIELREQMSKVYGIDLRSKSDAQIAEAVIVKEVATATGESVKRPEVPAGTRFNYEPLGFLKFETPAMVEAFEIVKRASFLVPDGSIQMPDELKKAVIDINGRTYKIGIGGLHSQEKTVSYFADDEHVLVDKDVTSYYPAIILNNGITPPHMGQHFTKSFLTKKEQRVLAKKAGNATVSDALKIVLNGAGGKLNSKWSKLYFPQGFIHMTLTGQLAILMLIERLELAGIAVVSANTDGIAIYCRKSLVDKMDEITVQWERETKFDTELTEYQSLHKHSVNSYIGLKTNGKFTLKGEYVMEELCVSKDRGIATNPANLICVEAVCMFLKNGTPIAETVRNCTDFRKMVNIRQVKGGAVDQSGAYLGKAVRWYYAKGVEGPLRYKINGYTVARSEGARPCMQLPESLPDDVDFAWYEQESLSILADVGVNPVEYAVRDLV